MHAVIIGITVTVLIAAGLYVLGRIRRRPTRRERDG